MAKIKVFGAGSLNVEGIEASDLLKAIDFHLGIEKKLVCHKIRRGPKKKSVALSGDSEVENTD